MKFTGVELIGGTELAASVEKAMIGPVEKTIVGPRALEGCSEREAWWRGRKMCCCALAWWRCRLAKQRRGGERDR